VKATVKSVVPSVLSLHQASDSYKSTATNETPKPRLNCCDKRAKSRGHDYDVVPHYRRVNLV
jgi:hypothetical protein